MPVKKFRELAEATRESWLEPGDPKIWEGAQRRWLLHRFFSRDRTPGRAGVFKYRSIEDKQRQERDRRRQGSG